MTMAGEVFVEGEPPFKLEAELATAYGHGANHVTLTLLCHLPRREGGTTIRGSKPEPLKVGITSAMAVQLAEQLLRAAAKSV
jgi:hypothetical protein